MSLKTIAVKSAAKLYVRDKFKEALKEGVLNLELNDKASTGLVKMSKLIDNFWDKLEGIVLREKSIDRKWVPNLVEEFSEDLLLEIIRDMKRTYDLRAIAQEAFDQLRSNGVI